MISSNALTLRGIGEGVGVHAQNCVFGRAVQMLGFGTAGADGGEQREQMFLGRVLFARERGAGAVVE